MKNFDKEQVLNTLSKEQRDFLADQVRRERKTLFANELAKWKASSVHDERIEEIANSWEFIDCYDAGKEWRETTPYHCECGKPLRYQYVITNTISGEIKKFGINHFEQHTEIPAALVKAIIKGFDKIDYERDEILTKIHEGWTLSSVGIDSIPNHINLYIDTVEHLKMKIPLLDRQVKRLRKELLSFLEVQAQNIQEREVHLLIKRAEQRDVYYENEEIGKRKLEVTKEDDTRYPTHKYKIYPHVALLLKELVHVSSLKELSHFK